MCDKYDETVDHLVTGCPVICPTKYKTVLVIRSIGRSSNIKKPHAIKTGMNTNQNLLLKQRVPQSFPILQYIQIEKLMPINLILQLEIIETTPVYLLS